MMFEYISFVLMQICWILLSGYIAGLVNLIFSILSIPFTYNKIINKILAFINVFFQNYITISVLMTNVVLTHIYYSSVNQDMNLIILTILSFLLYLLSIQSSAATRYKNETDYEIKSGISTNFMLSIIFSVVLFVLLSLSNGLIWTVPGELIYKFITWIQEIKVIGTVFNFVIDTISFLYLINLIWQLFTIIIALITALVNKTNIKKCN